jgi:hypothetical protein
MLRVVRAKEPLHHLDLIAECGRLFEVRMLGSADQGGSLELRKPVEQASPSEGNMS